MKSDILVVGGYSSEFIPGVYHLEQLLELGNMESWLNQVASLDIQKKG